MPFYEEYFREIPNGRALTYLGQYMPQSVTIKRSGSMRGFRHREPKAQWYREVPEISADPHAWFLNTLADVRDRGGQQVDFGHPCISELHEATYVTDDIVSKGYPPGTTSVSRNFQVWPLSSTETPDFPAPGMQARPKWADDLTSYGQQAIARTAPQAYNFSGTQFLGELREGIPSIVGAGLLRGRAKDVLKNAGSEYLNVQFGWLPLVSDVKNLASTLLSVDRLLTELRSHQGRPKHVRTSMPIRYANREMRDFSAVYISNNASALYTPQLSSPPLLPGVSSTVGNGYLSQDGYYSATLETRRWFEGSVVSYFEYPDTSAPFIEKALALIDMRLTPTILWELAPWSWLIDWIFHIQASIEANAIGANESVMWNYSYVMEKSVYRQYFSGMLTSLAYDLIRPTRVHSSLTSKYFRRIRGNPFGFSASAPGNLSASQLAILAALGLSR